MEDTSVVDPVEDVEADAGEFVERGLHAFGWARFGKAPARIKSSPFSILYS